MRQSPGPGEFMLKWRGDRLKVALKIAPARKGRAALRTDIGNAGVRRREIIAETEAGTTPLGKAWHDIALAETAPGCFEREIELDEVGVFSGKVCFFPEGSSVPEWPEGGNFRVKVESAETFRSNSVYTVFPRQFGSFREIVRRLPHIMDTMGFRILQTLPPFPVPTTYAVMGEYGCPFAATDFLSVDPAMAEFDGRTTPLDQFRELIGAVHARGGLFFIDLPANHTGWGSALQTHHPEWFRRDGSGKFISPGAWEVVWEDLVELDYSNAELCAYMADVFLHWCRLGVDGFRCDAGYMIAGRTWRYIVAKVREEYPDTVFMLEGLGGDPAVTDDLLADAGLDWAYSEIFQTYDRSQFEWYLPGAAARAQKYGTLVHFAETHDNDRLAKGGETYARLRVQLAALLSWQGAWGIANGVEWFCREKIDVHGRNDLNWNAADNMVELIARLNSLLARHPSFAGAVELEMAGEGDGNTLAVVRKPASDGDASQRLLVLANLDCRNPAPAGWNRAKFPAVSAFDLVGCGRVELSGTFMLQPGEVVCLGEKPMEAFSAPEAERAQTPEAVFHVVMPRDSGREVCIPAGALFEVSAPSSFRAKLTDSSGKTLRTARSSANRAVFIAPDHDGTIGIRCRRITLELEIYSDGRAQTVKGVVLIPPSPDDAAVAVSADGRTVRDNPAFRAILSNGAGAASQMRIGWGEIRSRYDAILAANPDGNVPSDRLNLWTRVRCWVQHEGYVREIDSTCVSAFAADPAGRFAKWDFAVPCGMGTEASFSFAVSLAEGRNVARIKVMRNAAPGRETAGSVRLVFRPDVEWRSFHATTKAFLGPERDFPAAAKMRGNGFVFGFGGDEFVFDVAGGEYHHEAQWSYSIGHAEEAERGQDGSGDLFSPGWVGADLDVGGEVVLTGRFNCGGELEFPEAEDLGAAMPIRDALRRAMDLFIVRRDNLKTVIAGYPWFLDWGRDTFIFMRGMIAAGMKKESLEILRAFAAFEENGTLPNIIYGNTAGNRDTTDAQLWFIRCVQELGVSDGKLLRVCNSIVDNYLKGTPNGIRVDHESALVWSPSHFTWMDTNYPACTPREGYPVEIQALWISALKFLGRGELADRAKASVERLFRWEFGYRDCLSAPAGVPAARAAGDDAIRPNQLFLITLGILDDKSILRASEELLVPGGVRSLNALHPSYRGVYTGDEDTRRKAAYHNGTVWAWPFPSYAEALAMTGAASRETALALLAGAVENLNSGCLCHMSEIADGDAPHAQKGCAAQAWSVSELLRVWLKIRG
ncbi:MAG: glycogen debranching enzyme N-terminal domain-containing protein [Kiritimatiellae bacterium]|nr:glycogen debranching enzyme N-terminal domain-containing protein [Kiritimatiellia bacterium]